MVGVQWQQTVYQAPAPGGPQENGFWGRVGVSRLCLPRRERGAICNAVSQVRHADANHGSPLSGREWQAVWAGARGCVRDPSEGMPGSCIVGRRRSSLTPDA